MTLTLRTPRDAARLGTVLGVWAHPDDEAYLSAGLMALARRAGNRVVCVTATRGEHGTDDPGRWPPGRLARTRELEVTASMAVLGVDEHRILGLEDGTLAGVPAADGVGLRAAPWLSTTDLQDLTTPSPRTVAAASSESKAYTQSGRDGRKDRDHDGRRLA